MEIDQRCFVHVVDDDERVRNSLTLLFRVCGFDAIAYSSADEFLEHFKPATNGILITDYQMSGRSGVDLIEELRRRDLLTPAVLYTGSAQIVDFAQIEADLLCVVVEKPCPFDRLHEALRDAAQVIDAHLARSE